MDLPTKLAQMQKMSQMKLEKLRKESEASQLEGCSFRPEIHPVKQGVYSQHGLSQYASPIR